MAASPPVATADRTDRPHSGTMAVDTLRCDATSALIRVTGELDLATCPPLWAVLQGHHRSGRRFLRLDVSGVTFLDATALSGIVATHDLLLADRGTLVLTGVRAPVVRVLRLTGLDDVLFVGGARGDGDSEAGLDLDFTFSELGRPFA